MQEQVNSLYHPALDSILKSMTDPGHAPLQIQSESVHRESRMAVVSSARTRSVSQGVSSAKGTSFCAMESEHAADPMPMQQIRVRIHGIIEAVV
jgi:hypothetical protein